MFLSHQSRAYRTMVATNCSMRMPLVHSLHGACPPIAIAKRQGLVRASTPRSKALTMASKSCCEAGAPVPYEYKEKKGQMSELNGRTLYLVGEGEKAIIFIHDIFGFDYHQVFQVADRIAAQGFQVAVPDMFMGDTWPMSDFPPSDSNKFMTWISEKADPDRTVNTCKEVQKYLGESKGAKQYGTVGFCWGGCVSLKAAADTSYAGNACCHPAFFEKEKEIAPNVKNPVCILPTKDDPMEAIKEILDKKSDIGHKCFYKRYDDQEHGFLNARGQFDDPKVSEAAGKAIEDLVSFFTFVMK